MTYTPTLPNKLFKIIDLEYGIPGIFRFGNRNRNLLSYW